MMAAAAAAAEGCSVCILEKNEKLGKKLFITGKGRCNLTNACDTEELFPHVCSNARFLYSSFYTFGNFAVMDFFEKLGVPLKTERGGRVFPVSDHSSDIIRGLERELKRLDVDVRLHAKVKKLTAAPRPGAVLEDGSAVEAGAVIVATGGLSYPSTGSTGDGYQWARDMGHKVTDCLPSLVPLKIEEQTAAMLQGLSLKNVEIWVKDGKKELYRGFGEMLFTHFGVSGPLILSASPHCTSLLADGKKLRLYIDLKPAITRQQLDQRLIRELGGAPNKQIKNILGAVYPAKMVPVVLAMADMDPETFAHSVTKEQRGRIGEVTKAMAFTVTGTRGFEEAIITRGGIATGKVNPSTMESRLAENIYFAGEVLDLDAVTGGFNLQIAWSTGYLAGMSAAKKIKKINRQEKRHETCHCDRRTRGSGKKYHCKTGGKRVRIYIRGHRRHVPGYGTVFSPEGHRPRRHGVHDGLLQRGGY